MDNKRQGNGLYGQCQYYCFTIYREMVYMDNVNITASLFTHELTPHYVLVQGNVRRKDREMVYMDNVNITASLFTGKWSIWTMSILLLHYLHTSLLDLFYCIWYIWTMSILLLHYLHTSLLDLFYCISEPHSNSVRSSSGCFYTIIIQSYKCNGMVWTELKLLTG